MGTCTDNCNRCVREAEQQLRGHRTSLVVLKPSHSESTRLLELSFGYFVVDNNFKNIRKGLENGVEKTTYESVPLICQL